MPGIFILSLDCEGKWGVADQLTEIHCEHLGDIRLNEAYRAVVSLLDEFGISATFAFTELFTLSSDQLLALPWEEITARLPYTQRAFSDFRKGLFEGWSAPWAKDMVSFHHEVGCHGVTHTPWDLMDTSQARFELSLAPATGRRTFVFPRNKVAHVALLEQAGFKGYRLCPPPRSRVASLASEFDKSVLADRHPPIGHPQPIPAGYFINWRSGLRKIVPPAWTRLRARNILQNAALSNGVAHFWTHPENIASAPSTLANLRAILEEAVILRATGQIVCLTQEQYCDYILG